MDIPPFHVLEVVRAAQALEATGRRVLHLEVGQPSTPAPALAPVVTPAVRARVLPPGGLRVATARNWAVARYIQLRVKALPSRNFQPADSSVPGS